jgi:hypothetical protein
VGKASLKNSGKYRRKKRLSAADLGANSWTMVTRFFRGISLYLRAMAAIKCFSDMGLTPAISLQPICAPDKSDKSQVVTQVEM